MRREEGFHDANKIPVTEHELLGANFDRARLRRQREARFCRRRIEESDDLEDLVLNLWQNERETTATLMSVRTMLRDR